jgi:hypothetical protein
VSSDDVLLDQSHGAFTVNLEKAVTVISANPEYEHIGSFYKRISGRFEVALQENGDMDEDPLASIKVSIHTAPNIKLHRPIPQTLAS